MASGKDHGPMSLKKSFRFRITRKETMVKVCSVYKSYSNKAGHQTNAAFRIPTDLERRKSWLKFLNRKHLSKDKKYIYICELNFEENLMDQNENRVRHINAKNPKPTMFPNGIENNSVLPNSITSRKLPTVRTFQNVEQKLDAYRNYFYFHFQKSLSNKFWKFLETIPNAKKLPYIFVFFKMESDENCIPKVSQCIRCDKAM